MRDTPLSLSNPGPGVRNADGIIREPTSETGPVNEVGALIGSYGGKLMPRYHLQTFQSLGSTFATRVIRPAPRQIRPSHIVRTQSHNWLKKLSSRCVLASCCVLTLT